MSAAIKKYGRESFTIEVLANAQSLGELDELEMRFIAERRTLAPVGYNLAHGGKALALSDIAKEKKRQSLLGHGVSEAARAKMSKAHSGRRFVEKRKPFKTAKPLEDRASVVSLDTRRKMSLAAKARPVVGTVAVIGEHIDTGETIYLTSMSSDPRFDVRLISACCRGKRQSHMKFKWRYAGADHHQRSA